MCGKYKIELKSSLTKNLILVIFVSKQKYQRNQQI